MRQRNGAVAQGTSMSSTHPLQVLMPRARAVWRAIVRQVWRFDDYSEHAELAPLSYTIND